MILGGDIYDSTDLPCKVVSIPFVKAYGPHLNLNEFNIKPYTTEPIPKVPFIIQFLESTKRVELRDYFLRLKYDLTGIINDLPGNYLTLAVANIVFNHQALNDVLLPPRINDVFSTSPYACSPLWLVYHLLTLEQELLINSENDDMSFRVVTLEKMKTVIKRTLSSLLKSTPAPEKSNFVIIEATKSISDKTILYCDMDNLDTYLATGGSVEQLGTDWIMRKTNPVV